jgi:hypothetical protein
MHTIREISLLKEPRASWPSSKRPAENRPSRPLFVFSTDETEEVSGRCPVRDRWMPSALWVCCYRAVASQITGESAADPDLLIRSALWDIGAASLLFSTDWLELPPTSTLHVSSAAVQPTPKCNFWCLPETSLILCFLIISCGLGRIPTAILSQRSRFQLGQTYSRYLELSWQVSTEPSCSRTFHQEIQPIKPTTTTKSTGNEISSKPDFRSQS